MSVTPFIVLGRGDTPNRPRPTVGTPESERAAGAVDVQWTDDQGAMAPLRVGIDMVLVADVADSVERLGHRYLYRVFTAHERACSRIGRTPRSPVYSMESLAARFAAKEATVKVLRPVGIRPEWRNIEVHRVDGGWCELRLTGLAAALAAAAGIQQFAVSLTHESLMAAACVVGMGTTVVQTGVRSSATDRKGE
jgi:holo-[acyl-carrier protein] synthase